jgi:prepilin-type N-terminal cleavage/methylation domain-containing protein
MRRAGSSGYTLIEIMIAVVVMTIGATGILAMQGASVRSNQDAAETSVAINFAATWMERLKRDARMWIASGPTDIASTRYLRNVGLGWVVPGAVAPEAASADFYGFDSTTDPRYCVNIRIAPVHQSSAAVGLDSVRADVVVWWHRTSSNDTSRSAALCATPLTPAQLGSRAGSTADDLKLRKHFLSTVLTFRAAGWP